MRMRAHLPRPLVGLLTIVTLLGGLLAEGVHRIVEPHTWCAVHEATEHGGEGQHAGDQVIGHAHVDAHHLETDTSTEEHEACPLPVLSNEKGTPFHARCERSFLPAAQVRLAALIERCTPPSIPRFRLAPKQSPPAV